MDQWKLVDLHCPSCKQFMFSWLVNTPLHSKKSKESTTPTTHPVGWPRLGTPHMIPQKNLSQLIWYTHYIGYFPINMAIAHMILVFSTWYWYFPHIIFTWYCHISWKIAHSANWLVGSARRNMPAGSDQHSICRVDNPPPKKNWLKHIETTKQFRWFQLYPHVLHLYWVIPHTKGLVNYQPATNKLSRIPLTYHSFRL